MGEGAQWRRAWVIAVRERGGDGFGNGSEGTRLGANDG